MSDTQEILRNALREKYSRSFYNFFVDAIRILKPGDDWRFNWHHSYLCQILDTESRRINEGRPKQHDFLINCPPAVTKSRLVSVCYNAWVWAAINPAHTFLCISNSDDLAIEFATDTKDLIQSEWYQWLYPEIQLRADTQAKSNFKNTSGGARISVSLLSKITGWHANFILIDDPHDSREVSDVLLERTVTKYRETIFNRLKRPSVDMRLIIGQRVHSADLSQYIIDNNVSGKYMHICLPMELTADVKPPELAVHYTNGVLWNDRFPPETFADLADSKLTWATQYLQRPSALTGNIVNKDWFGYEQEPHGIKYHLYIDTAETIDVKRNDPTTILIAGIHNNIVYIKDCQELWLEFTTLIRKIRDIAAQYPDCKVYVEPKSNGKAVVSTLRSTTLLNVIELQAPKDSKIVRLTSITPRLEARRVKLIRGPWNENFIYQLTTFPMAKHDGIVDVLCYAVNNLMGTSQRVRLVIPR